MMTLSRYTRLPRQVGEHEKHGGSLDSGPAPALSVNDLNPSPICHDFVLHGKDRPSRGKSDGLAAVASS